jgi:hypothetical protein
MTAVARSIDSFASRYDQALTALVPFFLSASCTNEDSARQAAKSILDGHRAATPKELQLAAEIVAYSWAALCCLSAGATVRQGDVDEMLNWQDSAIKLNRLSTKSTKALEARKKERAKNPNGISAESTRWDEGAFQLGINRALEKVMAANAQLQAFTAAMAPAPNAAPAPVQPKAPKVKMPILFAEQMTPAVLAKRARH